MKRSLLLTFLLISFSISYSKAQIQDCSELIISEYIEGFNFNKSVELYNPTNDSIDLSGYWIARFSNGSTTPDGIQLMGWIKSKSAFVVSIDYKDNPGDMEQALIDKTDLFLVDECDPNLNPGSRAMCFNGNDPVALFKSTDNNLTLQKMVDVMGHIGYDPEQVEGNSGFIVPGDPNNRWWTRNKVMIRKPNILHGYTDIPPTMNGFTTWDPSVEWDTLPNHTFDSLGMHTANCNTLSIEEFIANDQFNIFPNPSTKQDFVSIQSVYPLEKIEVFSSLGQKVLEANIIHSYNHPLFINGIEQGIYILHMTFTDGRKASAKLIIK